jgi:membrane protease YdiL (CAAX protease family)
MSDRRAPRRTSTSPSTRASTPAPAASPPPPAGPVVAWIRRHPVGAFLTWFFTVGQAFAFTPVVAREIFGVELMAQPFVVASTLVGLLLPALAITRIVDGPVALRVFWRRIWDVKVSWRWYALAVVLVPVVTTALAVAFFGAPDATGTAIAAALAWGLVVQGLLVLLSNNLWEEAAWAGFVQARLQDRHGAMRAAAITGPLFALQHVALVFGQELVVGVVFMVAFMIVAIPFRALQGWAYNLTGSLFLVGLIHAAGNAMGGGSGFGGAGLLPRIYEDPSVAMLHQLASAVLGLAVIAATRARLGSRRPRRGSTPVHDAPAVPVTASR